MDTRKIGWIGLGNMGVPMALNLLRAGFDLCVYNRSVDKSLPLLQAGCKVANSIQELCKSCELIFTMVSDDRAVKDIYADLLKENVTNKLFVNMSTISPDTSKAVAASCKYKGADYLEAPVSGSVQPAIDATLVILVGGNKANYERVLPLFEKLGKLTLHLGDVGLAASAKLAINYYLAITVQGIAETVLFAEKKGIPRDSMMQIINESACGSGISRIKTSAIINNEYPPAFPLKHMTKDVKMICEQGMRMPISKPVYETFTHAMNQDLGEEDVMAVIKILAEN